MGSTVELEGPFKIGPFFSVYPFYRYRTKTAADCFAAFKAHSVSDEYFTSDYNLPAFNSHKAGLGVCYSPLFGVARLGLPFTSSSTRLKSVDIRVGQYERSDGLATTIISTNLRFTLPEA